MSPSARTRILDALEQMLLVTGPSGFSLEDVATRAGVSKGGLLYHFSSKRALLLGFLDHAAELGRAEVAQITAERRDPVAAALAKAAPGWREEDPGFRAAVAAVRCADGSDPEVTAAVAATLRVWDDGLLGAVSDPAGREILRLLSYGLILDALLDISIDDGLHAEIVRRLSSSDTPGPAAP